MATMSLTRDVSQLSGWLKADASCRVPQAGHTVRGTGCAGREAGGGERARRARSVCRGERETADIGRWRRGEQRTQNM
jgi:hypothetical protein